MIRVPNTTTFSLNDVNISVGSHATVYGTLSSCYASSEPTYFDPNYNNDSYAVPNSLKRFRNYGDNGHPIFVPDGFSPNGDGVHDYFEVENLSYYPFHKMSIFNSGGSLMYQQTNNYHTYPWDGKYNGVPVSIGTYTWVLEINGVVYDNGTVLLAR